MLKNTDSLFCILNTFYNGDLLIYIFKGGINYDNIINNSISYHCNCVNNISCCWSHQYFMDVSARTYCGLDHQEDIFRQEGRR